MIVSLKYVIDDQMPLTNQSYSLKQQKILIDFACQDLTIPGAAFLPGSAAQILL